MKQNYLFKIVHLLVLIPVFIYCKDDNVSIPLNIGNIWIYNHYILSHDTLKLLGQDTMMILSSREINGEKLFKAIFINCRYGIGYQYWMNTSNGCFLYLDSLMQKESLAFVNFNKYDSSMVIKFDKYESKIRAYKDIIIIRDNYFNCRCYFIDGFMVGTKICIDSKIGIISYILSMKEDEYIELKEYHLK